jgi:glycosyltransferase involved in cell wall biosynthesis
MKVLHVNTSATEGGTGKAAFNINAALNDGGNDSWLLTARGVADASSKVLSLNESPLRLKCNVLAYRLLGQEGFFNQKLWSNWLSELEKFDVVHLHNVHGYYMPFEILDSLLSKPCVWTLHDYWLAIGGPASPIDRTSKKSLCNRLSQFSNFDYPAEWVDRSSDRKKRLQRLIDIKKPSIVVPTFTSSAILGNLGFRSSRVTVIPHGLFGARQSPNKCDRESVRCEMGWPSDKHIFLFASANVDNGDKGFDILLQSLDALVSDSGWVVYVAGGHSTLSQRKVARHGKLDIRFLGEQSKSNMRRCFSACDTYVSPTLSESFGMTVVEALAEGAQVVCSDLDVLREVTLGHACFFEVGSAAALAIELRKQLSSDTSSIPKTAVDEIRSTYSYSAMAKAYTNVYEQLVNETLSSINV